MSNVEPNEGGGDDTPPAWMLEDPNAWDDVQAQDAQWLGDEPLITDEFLALHPDFTAPAPDNASTVPHWLDGDPEDIEIFDVNRLAEFGKAKKAAEDLRKLA
jgi:hypothetical protein